MTEILMTETSRRLNQSKFNLSYFSTKTYDVGTQKSRLNEGFLAALLCQGPKFGPISNGIKVPFFQFSQHTHKPHGDILLQFNGNSMSNS